MKKLLSCILLLAIGTLLFSCTEDNEAAQNENSDSFVLKATVTAVGEKIEGEVIESDYAFGPYHVITSDKTVFKTAKGKTISKSDIKAGDTVRIHYGGQVMMSYPPQIVASQIEKL